MAKDKMAVVPTESPQVPVLGSDYAEDAGSGFETMTADHFLMPFVGILQKTSKLMDKLPNAKAGQILNTATQEQFDGTKGIRFVPVHTEHKFIEWIPRDSGGGYVGQFAPESPEVMKSKQDAGTDYGKLSIKDNDLVETFYTYGLRIDDDGNTYPEVIPFSSTQIKSFKTWMTKARGIKLKDKDQRSFPAPLYAHVYRLTTQFTENSKGSWHIWNVAFDGETPEDARIPASADLYREVKELRGLVVQGHAKIDFEKSQDLHAESGDIPQSDKF